MTEEQIAEKKREKAAYDKLYRERTRDRRLANRDHRNRVRRAWKARNKDKIREENRRQYLRNVEARKAAAKAYHQSHPEWKRETGRRWRAENYERHLANKRAWREKNREKIRAQKNEARARNPEKYREVARAWRKTCSPESREVMRKNARDFMSRRLASDPTFKLLQNCRGRIRAALRGTEKSKRTVELIGCSISDLKTRIESLFLPGMTWEKFGRHGIHIDHIAPCSWFDLSDPVEQKQCFHYTNLRPLWGRDNQSKSDKVIPELHGPNIPTIQQLTSIPENVTLSSTESTREGDTHVG